MPLADVDEPPAHLHEPEDEASRKALPLGTFTGVVTAEARRTLDEAEDGSFGIRVQRVVENSPGDVAGLEEDDLLLEATVLAAGAGSDAAAARPLAFPSDWRKIELETPPGGRIRVLVDRAGAERMAEIVAVRRVRVPERTAAHRYREEKKVGIVVRTATEVEARGAGLGPGGGAVVVGLSAGSPWRAAGIRFGDLIAKLDGADVSHPQEVVNRIRDRTDGAPLSAEIVRKGERSTIELPTTTRAQEIRRVSIPFLYSYELDRGASETSVLAGAIQHRTTRAAWEWRLFWLLRFAGGDADRLEEVSK